MQRGHLPRRLIEKYTVYRYVGPGFVMGIPARDLTEADLAEIQERERISRAQVEASGLYVRSGWVEVAPFCGAPNPDGDRCRERVSAWGERCEEHKEVGDEFAGIS